MSNRDRIIQEYLRSHSLSEAFVYCSTVPVHGTYPAFSFRIVWTGSFYEMDILSLPDYQGRPTCASVNHWLTSSRGGRKICIATGHEPRNGPQAIKIAMEWSDLQAEYIRSGTTPDQQLARR